MANSGIYKIVNQINGKEYYGSTNDFNRRCYRHFNMLTNNKHDNKHLQASVDKHGIDNFLFMIVEYIEDEAKLLDIEQNYLDVFWDNSKNCYNICPVAGSTLGYKHTDESKANMSKAQAGRKLSDEHIANMSKALTGKKRKPFTEEHKANISKKRQSDEAKANISKKMTGRKKSDEHKANISKANKGKKRSQKTKDAIKAAWAIRKAS